MKKQKKGHSRLRKRYNTDRPIVRVVKIPITDAEDAALASLPENAPGATRQDREEWMLHHLLQEAIFTMADYYQAHGRISTLFRFELRHHETGRSHTHNGAMNIVDARLREAEQMAKQEPSG